MKHAEMNIIMVILTTINLAIYGADGAININQLCKALEDDVKAMLLIDVDLSDKCNCVKAKLVCDHLANGEDFSTVCEEAKKILVPLAFQSAQCSHQSLRNTFNLFNQVNVSSLSIAPTPLVVMATSSTDLVKAEIKTTSMQQNINATPTSSIMVPVSTSAVGKITPSSASAIMKTSMMSSMTTNSTTTKTDDRNAADGIIFTYTLLCLLAVFATMLLLN